MNKNKIIAGIRKEFAYMGFDLSDFTDEEIESGVQKTSEIMSKFGLTCEEATAAFNKLSSIANKAFNNK